MFTLFAILRRLVPAAAALLCLVGAASAAEWRVANLRGAALFLEGEKWHELRTDTRLQDPAMLRTMGSGRVNLTGPGLSLNLGGSAAVEVRSNERGALIRHFAGTVAAAARGGRIFDFETPFGVVCLQEGQIRVVLLDQRVQVELLEGSGTMVNLSGDTVKLAAGAIQSLSALGSDEQKPGNPTGGNAGNSAAGGNGHGNGNSGANDDNGASGNAGAGGQGQGQGQSQGNSDSAGGNGNGNGNSGGNGNSNAGGNGNGNGNAGGNGTSDDPGQQQ